MTNVITPATLLDRFLPIYDLHEIHTITVQAPPRRVFRAIKNLTPSELSPLIHILFTLRSLPNRLNGNGAKPIVEQILSVSFILLAEETNRELVLGKIGQFWRARGSSGR